MSCHKSVLPTAPERMLKVKPLGEQYYRELRVPLPCGYERLLSSVGRTMLGAEIGAFRARTSVRGANFGKGLRRVLVQAI